MTARPCGCTSTACRWAPGETRLRCSVAPRPRDRSRRRRALRVLRRGYSDVAIYPQAIARSSRERALCRRQARSVRSIAGAGSSTYTPALADLGQHAVGDESPRPAPTAARASAARAKGRSMTATASSWELEGWGEGETVSGNGAGESATSSGLPADRMEWDVDGQYRYAKPGEPPYQYTWYTAAEANGPHTRDREAMGAGRQHAGEPEMTVDVAQSDVHPMPLALGEESVYAEMDEGEEATAQDLLGNVWPARGATRLPYLEWPLTWQEDPYHEAYWEFYFYGLRPEATLLYEWKTTGNGAYLEKLIAILRSYDAYDRTRPTNTVTFDNDHTSAYRTMELINFYVKLKIARCAAHRPRRRLGKVAGEARSLPCRTEALRGRLQPWLQRGSRAVAAGGQLPPHAGRRHLAAARARTPAADAHQHDRRRRRGGGELPLLPGVRVGSRLSDRPVGQALRARARRPLRRSRRRRCSGTRPT